MITASELRLIIDGILFAAPNAKEITIRFTRNDIIYGGKKSAEFIATYDDETELMTRCIYEREVQIDEV